MDEMEWGGGFGMSESIFFLIYIFIYLLNMIPMYGVNVN